MHHIKIPDSIISRFVDISSKNISRNLGHIETLAFLIGYEKNNEVTATELVLPKQDGTPNKVDDLGINEYVDTVQWILNKSDTYLDHGNVKIIAWIHSHVQGNHNGLSSIDVHTQWAFEKINKNIFCLVFEFGKSRFWLDHDYYVLTEIGTSAIKTCINNFPRLSKVLHTTCKKRYHYKSIKSEVAVLASLPCIINCFMTMALDLNESETNNKNVFDRKCEGCLKYFEIECFFKHVSHAKKCKQHYGNRWNIILEEKKKINVRKRDEVKREKNLHEKNKWDALLIKSKTDVIQNRMDAEDRATAKYKVEQKKQKLEESKKSELAKDFDKYVSSNRDRGYAQDQKFLMHCKGCNQSFSTHTFYRHVSHSSNCKKAYGNEWIEMKTQKRKIVKGAYYDVNHERHLKNVQKYHEDNKKSISTKKKEYYREERGNIKRKRDGEFEKFEEQKQFYENIWKPRMEKNTRDFILKQKYFFEASICEKIKKLRTKSLNEEMDQKLKNLEAKAKDISNKIEADAEEAIQKAKCVVFFKKIESWHKSPHDVVFDIYKSMNVNHGPNELRQEWVLLEKESRVILKEIADELGEELEPRVYWFFFKSYILETCFCEKEPKPYKPSGHQCTSVDK